MNDMTHDRCSELLRSYISGDIGAPERTEVEGHLSGCPDCSQELIALQALAAPELVGMTGAERDRMATAVRAAVFPVARSWSERWRLRVAPALGAVALITIAAVAVVSLQTTDTGLEAGLDADLGDTGGGGSVEQDLGYDAQDGASADSSMAAPEAATEAQMKVGQGGDAAGTTGDAATAAGTSGSLRAAVGMVVSDQSFAVSGIDVVSLVPARVPDGFGVADSVVKLANSAPDERIERLVRTCARQTTGTSTVGLVATSATYYPQDDVLVIGFVWIDEPTGDLYFEIRGWINGDCDGITPIFRRGRVDG